MRDRGAAGLPGHALGEVPHDETELLRCQEDLALEAMEHSLASEQLEVRERQAATAEDAVAAREARI